MAGPKPPDMAPPPGAQGPEAAGQTLRPAGPPPESPAEAAGRAEAAQATKSLEEAKQKPVPQQEKQIDEALKEVARELPPETKIEEIIQMPGSDTAFDNAPESANIDVTANAPGEGQDKGAEEKPEDALKNLTDDQLTAERIATEAAIKVYDEELEKVGLWPTRKREMIEENRAKAMQRLELINATQPVPPESVSEPERPAEAEPATAAKGGGGGAEEPPAPEAATPAPEGADAAQLTPDAAQRAIDEYARRVQEATQARQEELRSWTPEQFQEEMIYQGGRLAGAERTINTPRLPDETYQRAEQIREDAQSQINELRAFSRQTLRGAGGGRQEEIAAAELEAQELADFAAASEKKNPEDRTADRISLEASKKALKKKLSGTLTQVQRDALNRKLQNLEAMSDALNEIDTRKGPEEEKAKKETEAKKNADEAQKLQGKFSPVEDIKGIVDAHQKELNGIKAELKKNAEDREKATDDETRTRLDEERDELNRRLAEVGERLESERGALDAARKREREEFTLEGGMGEDTLREMSREAFKELIYKNPAEAGKYLKEVLDSVGSATPAEIARIQQAILNGEYIGLKDRAQYQDALSQRLINQRGRTAEDLQLLPYLNRRYPDIYAAVTEAVINDKQSVEQVKQILPSGWEKALRFAKNNPGWLMIILAIIAAGGAAAAVATVPGVGVAAGLGGAGVAGLGGRQAWHRR